MGSYNFSTEKYINDLKSHDDIYFRHALEFIGAHADKSSYILDVGTGTGNLVKILRDRGYANAYGVELDSGAVSTGINELGLGGKIFDVESFPFRKKMFDVVLSFTVGEHVGNIGDFIDFKNSFLKDGGIFYIYMPNYHSPIFYLKTLLSKLKGETLHKTPFNEGSAYDTFAVFIKMTLLSLYKIITGKVSIQKVDPLPPEVSEGGDADAVWRSNYLDVRNSFLQKKHLRFDEIDPPSLRKIFSREFFAAKLNFLEVGRKKRI